MENKDIRKILPHRYPFLLVDRIIELEEGKRAVGIKNVTSNEPFFQGHFPDNPIMPGVLIVEALAQVAGIAVMNVEEFKGKLGLFAGIDKCRFKKVVRPGDQLILEVSIDSIRMGLVKAKGVAKVGEEIAATAELMFVMAEE
ncbi:3-hydroxyacyl-[acyl-carrier-protein] dehydratase [Caldanaerobacter subterraneus subsp. tengcongensis MB4]|uniref:3-hydroxyacyl-[acyl-carrier-protein] dehydratase FabZ n=1 Tax=Caldanaerobacter subterraneus subsp. tengcongensis (strain DSM 15242 / JCM 11007 / NBRC 100824 / MB4) TaxID=273068 RepID=FABZ_CALS4|nr:3-hydroxyacyl-ACP dehydratase FabZ [Caldanaerobacter subterraneus]Q8RD71.1 RecName: Full=3-hydroxyacyl-[acyl-carrier-protein] dehydratase FabZ; AltName: Full=(3R)-hydroxymyristoyl-[acyl-carrier-protein] dehydratase; Short=(3R)-hydroxymyristoyl-ACP dehydrase; AltName: Full=Beta-hydroxyacyl-ACP dehydratase [Caldanaerobacter subterraneus subsp. tengcongensis MB4]AAM23476.1 3-hydroxymyristoyl/3-hydroxydecanoyl-(acyl carrier protein) dehydratases [Caldanaerobacter subterraneus subsp. tengcongensis 